MKLCVTDYPTPQDAFNAARHGDKVYFPGLDEYEAPEGGWMVGTSVEIYGDGPGSISNNTGTVLRPKPGPGNHVLVLAPAPGTVLVNVNIHDLKIVGDGDGGDGIRFVGSANQKLGGLRIERVAIVGMGGAGIALLGDSNDGGHVVSTLIADTLVKDCLAEGIVLTYAFQTCVISTRLDGNGKEGLKATNTQLTLYVCSFEANCQSSGEAELLLDTCSIARVDSTRFKNFGGTGQTPLPAVVMNGCQGVGNVGGCVFDLGSLIANSKGIQLGGAPNGAIVTLPNRFVGVASAVIAPDTAVACVVLPQYCENCGPSPISLPSQVTDSPLAVPGFNTGSGNKAAGLLVPPFLADPATNRQGGMLATVDHSIRVFIDGLTDQFKTIQLGPPDPVVDLAFGRTSGRTSLIVTWTAPHDPGSTGPVAAYDLRYSVAPITAQNFSSATHLPLPDPLSPGSPECAELSGLGSCTVYYAAIKSQDQSGKWSAISNVPSALTRCSGTIQVNCP